MKILLQKGDRIEITKESKWVDEKKGMKGSSTYTCTVMQYEGNQCYKTVLNNIDAIVFFENVLNMTAFGTHQFVEFALMHERFDGDFKKHAITVKEVRKDGNPVFEIYDETLTASEAIEEWDKRTAITTSD